MKLALFETLTGFGGGNIYQRNIIRSLEGLHTVEVIRVKGNRWLGMRMGRIAQAAQALKQHPEIDLWICTYLPTISRTFVKPAGKIVSLFYHLDDTLHPNPIISRLLRELYFRNARKCDGVVTIAEYWKTFLIKQNVQVSDLIYWGFDTSNFDFTAEQVQNFRQKYGFNGKPLIYLGNCQESKGVIDAYNQLKDLDAHLVTSGERRVQLPIPNLELSYADYRLLLASSDVVLTLSKFAEGWNGTAHEAMLSGTPVIGSGLGGMNELLQGGGQIICNDLTHLSQHVAYAIKHSDTLSKSGRDYASQFTKERFDQSWRNLVSRYER